MEEALGTAAFGDFRLDHLEVSFTGRQRPDPLAACGNRDPSISATALDAGDFDAESQPTSLARPGAHDRSDGVIVLTFPDSDIRCPDLHCLARSQSIVCVGGDSGIPRACDIDRIALSVGGFAFSRVLQEGQC